MADISTLTGISEARQKLYDQVEKGDIPDQRAAVMDRILRGQTYLHGDLRLKAIRTVLAFKGGDKSPATEDMIGDLHRFLTPGQERKLLGEAPPKRGMFRG